MQRTAEVAKGKRKETAWGVAMGERLQRLRLAKSLSQPQLAKAANVPVASLRSWEQGKREPLLSTAARLAVALGCTVGQLAGTEPEPGPTEEKKGKAKGK
jgi:transcriptional regulator with XRE-family HTH domain